MNRQDEPHEPRTPPPEEAMVSVVVPVFNEEECLPELYERLREVLRTFAPESEMLFVDDGSTDRSFAVLSAFHEADGQVRVIRFVRNFGQQMAVSAGLRNARGKIVAILDADLQTPPEELPKLVAKLREGYDIVYGVRERRHDPLWRRLGSWAMSNLLYRVIGIQIPDAASNCVALDRRLVDNLNLYNERSRYFSGLFAWLSYGRHGGVPVRHQDRAAGQSKYRLTQLVTLTLNFVCNFSTIPLRLPLYLGVLLCLVGVVGAVVVAAELLAGYLWLPPEATAIISALAFLTGLQLFAVGLLGQYVGRIYTEVRQQPPYVVWEVLDHAHEAGTPPNTSGPADT
jgi:glycosyltransferase involved in cell wall biosynthesis